MRDSGIGSGKPDLMGPTGPPPSWSPRSQPRRSRRLLISVIAAVAVMLIAGATTTVVLVSNHRADVRAQEKREQIAADAQRQAAAEQRAAEEKRRQEAERVEAERARILARFETCQEQLTALIDVLSEVDARLDVGLSQSDLSTKMGDASVAYSKIEPSSLEGTCLSAGAKLEAAFNDYNGTVSTWSDCIFDTYCDVDSDILPAMQKKWSSASMAIDEAKSLLDTLDPDSPKFRADKSGGTTA